METTFPFKTTPFPHQLEKFLAHRDAPSWGHLWEQGTGKTKEDIDQTAYQFMEGLINGVVVVAPNGVHENWVADEIPTHLPENVAERTMAFTYHSTRAKTKGHQRALEDLLAHDGLAFLAITYDAIMTKAGRAYVEKFLRVRKAKMTLDESSRIKNPGAKRSKAICTIGKRADYRRIYSGTPVPNGPFDIYPQVKFLDWDFWARHGFANFTAFKTHFGIWRAEVNSQTGGRFEYCVGYKNLEELYDILSTITDRLVKEDVLDLPEKLYTPRTFELSSQQAKLYQELKEEGIAWLDEEADEAVHAEMPIVMLLRLQQIACGWIPRSPEDIEAGDDEPIYEIPGGNPRLDLLAEIVEDLPHQAIIWARFRGDIDRIIERLDKMGKTSIRYDGAIPPGPERTAAKHAFNNGDAQFFVANPAVGGQGLTLIGAKTTIYYSNSFDLDHRLQSEDRNHRIGQDVNVNYIDLMARGTIDGDIVTNLRKKIRVAATITGDRLREWL